MGNASVVRPQDERETIQGARKLLPNVFPVVTRVHHPESRDDGLLQHDGKDAEHRHHDQELDEGEPTLSLSPFLKSEP